MNVLMLTNYPPSDLINGGFVNESWVSSMQKQLQKFVVLHIAFPSTNGIQEGQLSSNTFYFGYTKSSDLRDYRHISIIDVVHIMGTEFSHAYSNYQVCCELGLENRTVVSIQGLVSFCAQHYLYGVPAKYCRGFSVVEAYSGFDSLQKKKKAYYARGISERKLLESCRNVMGRTDWDRRCIHSINSSAQYFHGGEILRDVFYTERKWSIENCERHSIFISQATYSLKGFHHILGVLPTIVERYPDVKVYVGGANPISSKKWKMSSYARFLMKLIENGKLEKHIIFCGAMTAEKMHERYLKSHVFLSPSNIENSSNSIGEALILGVPVVASNVGGTDCIVNDGVDGLLYPLTEPYIMAEEIIEIFSDDDMAAKLSKKAMLQGDKLHNPERNVQEILSIYKEVIESDEH